MIDTIVIILDKSQFVIFEPDRFYPSAKEILTRTIEVKKAIQNPTRKDYKAGVFLPRLTLYKRPSRTGYVAEITLKVEFSIPKMLFSNNFDELTESDFDLVVITLKEKLSLMGIEVYSKGIENSLVSLIHYGKNYVLTDYRTPYSYIQEIKKANISRVYDTNQTDYRNEGHSFKYRNNSFEVIFYDKIKDLVKAKVSPKRSEEREDTLIQLGLFDTLKPQKRKEPFEVLRMEIRLNNRRKIKSELKKLGFDVEPTFRNLFSKEIAQTVCLRYLEDIRSKMFLFTLSQDISPTKQISELIANNPHEKPEFIFQYFAFIQVVNEHDVRTARQFIDPQNSSKWYRIKKRFNNIKTPGKTLLIDKLIAETKEFETIKLVDFPQLMINNDKNEIN